MKKNHCIEEQSQITYDHKHEIQTASIFFPNVL